MGRLHGFQRYHIGKGGYGFLNRFFFGVVKHKHNYFCDKSHLLLGRLSVKAELEQGSDRWSMESESCQSNVANVICNLRKKIEPDSGKPTYIKTVLGVGYKFASGE